MPAGRQTIAGMASDISSTTARSAADRSAGSRRSISLRDADLPADRSVTIGMGSAAAGRVSCRMEKTDARATIKEDFMGKPKFNEYVVILFQQGDHEGDERCPCD